MFDCDSGSGDQGGACEACAAVCVRSGTRTGDRGLCQFCRTATRAGRGKEHPAASRFEGHMNIFSLAARFGHDRVETTDVLLS